MTHILVLADTHIGSWEQLAPPLALAVAQADWVVHCGDFTGREFLDELRRRSRNFAGVFGNTDGSKIRQELLDKVTLEIEGKRFVITHPSWGGPPEGIEEELLSLHGDADAILFGHTHEPLVQQRNHTLLFNPGQGYPAFGYPATYGILTIAQGKIEAEIRRL